MNVPRVTEAPAFPLVQLNVDSLETDGPRRGSSSRVSPRQGLEMPPSREWQVDAPGCRMTQTERRLSFEVGLKINANVDGNVRFC